jgi:hypothetical protein
VIKKRGTFCLNGKERVTVQTLHGTFTFAKQRLVHCDGTNSDYLEATKQQTVSAGLEELGLYYVNRLSFAEVERLVERVSGRHLVCAQTLWNWALQKAHVLDKRLRAEVAACEDLPLPEVTTSVDIYDGEAEEVLMFTDAIGVKAQKPKRDKPGAAPTGKPAKRHDTDVFLLERPGGDFVYVAGSTDKVISLMEAVKARVRREWGHRTTPLPVVAITDGARCIRTDLVGIFGVLLVIILDWYHLQKRVYEHLAMSAHSRAQREEWECIVLGFLWHGQVAEALSFLRGLSARNVTKRDELVGYLDRHATEIIDYERRLACGKPIGSGRMEKAVDQVIGIRQKKKGMSWSEQGSRTLASLKIAELNGQWDQLFAA